MRDPWTYNATRTSGPVIQRDKGGGREIEGGREVERERREQGGSEERGEGESENARKRQANSACACDKGGLTSFLITFDSKCLFPKFFR